MGITKKTEKREARREEKAEKAAKIESSIESALLERLKKGTYGDIYNFPVEEYNKALDEEERLAEEMDLQDEEEDGNVEFVEDFSDLDEDDLEDCTLPPPHNHHNNRVGLFSTTPCCRPLIASVQMIYPV